MADPDQCKNTSVGGAAQTTIVLAFDLVDKEIPKVPARILKSLESKEVQDAIKATLTKFAQSRAQSATTVVSDKEAKDLAEALAKGVGERPATKSSNRSRKVPSTRTRRQPQGLRSRRQMLPHGRLGRQEPDHPLHRRRRPPARRFRRSLHHQNRGAAVDLPSAC